MTKRENEEEELPGNAIIKITEDEGVPYIAPEDYVNAPDFKEHLKSFMKKAAD